MVGKEGQDKNDVLERWSFQWPVVDVLVNGQSSIDLTELRFKTWQEATGFLRAYGFDPDDPKGKLKLDSTFVEAVVFMENQLIHPREWARGVRPPSEILKSSDVRQLLLWASGNSPEERLVRAWSCAILRVMHTISHIDGLNRTVNFEAARDQIFQRFRSYLFRKNDGLLCLGDPTLYVNIHHLEWKPQKTRDSIILKLLHKRDNVAETIYDYLGVRIVTQRVCDVVLAVKCLRAFNMVVFPNAYPSRARNTLIDLQKFKNQVETLRAMLLADTLTVEQFEEMVGRIQGQSREPSGSNPHSSSTYRSVQLTGRQLIKMESRGKEWLLKLAKYRMNAQSHHHSKVFEEFEEMVKDWYSTENHEEDSAFFPFEVQIMDKESFEQARDGEANHDRYKTSQMKAARKRVLWKVLELNKHLLQDA